MPWMERYIPKSLLRRYGFAEWAATIAEHRGGMRVWPGSVWVGPIWWEVDE